MTKYKSSGKFSMKINRGVKQEVEVKGRIFSLLLVGCAIFSPQAFAEWTSLSAALPEADIRRIAVDPTDSKIIYAASEKRIYKSPDDGRSWAQVFGLWGLGNKIQFIYLDPSRPGTVYAAAENGVWISTDSGKKWNLFYRGVGGETKKVFCVASYHKDSREMLLGTGSGLVVLATDPKEAKKIPNFPNIAVHSILSPGVTGEKFLVLAVDGIYQSIDGGVHWQRVLASPEPEAGGDEKPLQGMGMEEALLSALPTNLIYHPAGNKFLAATPRGVYETGPRDLSWKPIKGKAEPGGRINYLTASSLFFYAATDRGVYRWDPGRATFFDISQGLGSPETAMILFDAPSDRLLAATKKGIFQFFRPEAELPQIHLNIGSSEPHPTARDILNFFEQEPTIAQIQKAAIEYAEVHPRKIQEWRAAAQKKAWLPTVSLSQKINRDRNVDVDRGGTGDADRFIEGPEDVSNDWSVGMSWDLGDLVWNDDQTSIDTRSRLMVQLRDDVLNDVTHLFYERRRLQAERIIRPAKALALEVQRQLRFEELTADIDGLTGGYLSAHLNKGAL